jgi:hypothetical protein
MNNKKFEISELNDGDHVIFLHYLNDKYLVFNVDNKYFYVPMRNELLIALIQNISSIDMRMKRSWRLVSYSMVILNGVISIVKYGERISSIVAFNKDRLFSNHFPSVLNVSVEMIQNKYKSFDHSYISDSNIDMTSFYENEYILFNEKIYNLLRGFDKEINKNLLANNFDFFLKTLKKLDNWDVDDLLNNKTYAPIIRQYKLQTLGFDE